MILIPEHRTVKSICTALQGFLSAGATVTFDFVTATATMDDTATGGFMMTPYVGEAYLGATKHSVRMFYSRSRQGNGYLYRFHRESGTCIDLIEH